MRFGKEKSTTVKLDASPIYKISLNQEAFTEALANRKEWLSN